MTALFPSDGSQVAVEIVVSAAVVQPSDGGRMAGALHETLFEVRWCKEPALLATQSDFERTLARRRAALGGRGWVAMSDGVSWNAKCSMMTPVRGRCSICRSAIEGSLVALGVGTAEDEAGAATTELSSRASTVFSDGCAEKRRRRMKHPQAIFLTLPYALVVAGCPEARRLLAVGVPCSTSAAGRASSRARARTAAGGQDTRLKELSERASPPLPA
jgi:hypothetical protein